MLHAKLVVKKGPYVSQKKHWKIFMACLTWGRNYVGVKLLQNPPTNQSQEILCESFPTSSLADAELWKSPH